MRITGVEIANYGGFAGDSFRPPLENGEKLLVYGEDGAGKSSPYNSLTRTPMSATHTQRNQIASAEGASA
jgi:ABC-type multidrug transport system fused ATPase/permease subunit